MKKNNLFLLILICALFLPQIALCDINLPEQAVMPDRQTTITPRSVLVAGDSLSVFLGEELEEFFRNNGNPRFKRVSKVSSGLTRPEFFNWELNLESAAREMKPDLVYIVLGANDNKHLETPRGLLYFGTPEWKSEYASRVDKLFRICRTYNPNAMIIWVGVPVMAREPLASDARRINALARSRCAVTQGCRYIDTWNALADEHGRFTYNGFGLNGEAIPIRHTDGVHITRPGARILAQACLKDTYEFFDNQSAIRQSKDAGLGAQAMEVLTPPMSGIARDDHSVKVQHSTKTVQNRKQSATRSRNPSKQKISSLQSNSGNIVYYHVKEGDTIRILSKHADGTYVALRNNPGNPQEYPLRSGIKPGIIKQKTR